MREKVLLNERYGTVEVDSSGIITGYNNKGQAALSVFYKKQSSDNLKGLNIAELSGTDGVVVYNSDLPCEIISSLSGIIVIDYIVYKDTGNVIIRFAPINEVFVPFFKMIKTSSLLYMELDKDLNILFMSDMFVAITGINTSDMYGSGISSFTDKSSTVKIGSAAELCNKNVNDSTKINDIQFSFKGIVRIFDMELSTATKDQGSVPSIFCYLIDRFYEKKCKTMVRTIRRMSAVANFAGGIAHDYNNALTAVLGNISLAKMDAEKDSELEELLDDAESAGLKIKTLTERLGMFARGMKPAKDETDIKKLLENILPEVLAGYKGQCVINIKENMTHPEIDQELVSEAVKHVIENAVDAVDRPDGEITIEAGETEVNQESVFRETSLVSGKYIVISVKDNGTGVDKLSVKDIFDPYVTTKNGREGLGLALAYTILKRHRGFISVDTAPGGGADFRIYIPLF